MFRSQYFLALRLQHRLDTTKKVKNTAYFQAVENLVSPFIIRNDAGLAQDRQMFGNGRDISADHCCQVADAAFPFFQFLDNEQTGRMGQGLDDPGAGQQMVFLLLVVISCRLHVWQYSQIGAAVKLFFMNLKSRRCDLTSIRMGRYGQFMKNIAHIFKALSDETRLRILALLSLGELCVCDLMEALELPQSTVSRHLAYLRNAGLVEDERRGVWMFYRLNQTGALGEELLRLLLEKLNQSEQIRADQRALDRLTRSSGKKCC